MVKKEEIDSEIRNLVAELIEIDYNTIFEFPFKAYLSYLEKAIPNFSHLFFLTKRNDISPFTKTRVKDVIMRPIISIFLSVRHIYITHKRRDWFKSIVSSYESVDIHRYNRLVLLFLMRSALESLQYKDFPIEIVDLYHRWFKAILNDFHERSDIYFDVEEPAFRADINVCCFRWIPVGGAWAVGKSRIDFGYYEMDSPWQLLKNLYFIIRNTGGFSPFYGIHTVRRYIHLYQPEQMNLAYLRIAELMKRSPSIRGIIRKGWLLDPNLEKVSPNLAFLRTIPEENGARLFRSITTKQNVIDALSMSSIRRRIYDEGKYEPAAYSYVWPKKLLFEWAEKYKEK